MTPRVHQIEGAVWGLATIRKYGLAYLGWKERTGKTLTSLLIVENSKAKTCLIVTKKKAISGWEETLGQWVHDTVFEVINYESIHKVKKSYDFYIFDEAHHAIASIGRTSTTWKKVKLHTKGKPILYLSATPYAETVGQLYHQLKLSDWTPFKEWKNYYKFHEMFGIPKTKYTSYGPQLDRSVFRVEEVLSLVDHLFSWKTRQDVGIEHEPTTRLVKVSMQPRTKERINVWKRDRVIHIQGWEIFGDSDAKIRAVHYQLEGGTLKIDGRTSIQTGTYEKCDYINSNYGGQSVAVMAHFIAERSLIQRLCPHVRVLSSDGDAEGVDLSDIDKLVVYSMSFKTSKHTQRVARQANHDRTTPIEVDILVMGKPGVGEAVYETVAVKETNFVKASYERAIS